MSQITSCDCIKKTCRHQYGVAEAESQHITHTESPASPDLPHLTGAEIEQELAEAQRRREENFKNGRRCLSPMPDSQPMFLDEDANDGWISDPERFDN